MPRIRAQIAAAVSAVAGLIALGTVTYHYLEGWTWIQSFYFYDSGYGNLVGCFGFSVPVGTRSNPRGGITSVLLDLSQKRD